MSRSVRFCVCVEGEVSEGDKGGVQEQKSQHWSFGISCAGALWTLERRSASRAAPTTSGTTSLVPLNAMRYCKTRKCAQSIIHQPAVCSREYLTHYSILHGLTKSQSIFQPVNPPEAVAPNHVLEHQRKWLCQRQRQWQWQSLRSSTPIRLRQ